MLGKRVVSTVTAAPLEPAADVHLLLTEQITQPVEFAGALTKAALEVDLFIEVGPGEVLSGIAAEITDKPCVPMDSGGESLRGLCNALGAAFALGVNVRTAAIHEGRFARSVDLRKRHSFLQNPCEMVADVALDKVPARVLTPSAKATSVPDQGPASSERANSAQDVLLNLVSHRTHLPLAAIHPEQRFLADLHLNSITISQIMLQAADQINAEAPVAPAEYTNATIAEAAATLETLRSRKTDRRESAHPAGVDSWIRTLAVELVQSELRKVDPAKTALPGAQTQSSWQVTALNEEEDNQGGALVARLEEAFHSVSGDGLVCCVPAERAERAAEFLLRTAQAALKGRLPHVVFVQRHLQNSGGAAALARTLYLENPKLKVTVVNVPYDHPRASEWVRAEAMAAIDTKPCFTEAHYDSEGIRREPRLKLLWPDETPDVNPEAAGPVLGPDDVLLVTGGGSGIAAESALQLARMSGCKLAVLGRRDPASDAELAGNLARISGLGVKWAYFSADVTDEDAVRSAVQRIQSELGPVTAVLHGAGSNEPKLLSEITGQDLRQTLAPKLIGLRNILSAIAPDKLRLLLTFGSIIARTGLHGEAHYGLANEWMNLEVERWQNEHPQCRCMNLEWSVWAGVGMGQRMGVLESLVRQDITPLPVDEAIAHMKTMLAWKQAPVSAIITGRFGNLPTLKFPTKELPLRRFLESVRVHHPGIELIADCQLSVESDPYLAEHVIQGEYLLPAVMGMEAMAQVAMVLEAEKNKAGTELHLVPDFQNLRFEHPIAVPRGQTITLRVAALRRAPGMVSVVIRSSITQFQVDHFSGDCVFTKQDLSHSSVVSIAERESVDLQCSRDLYGRILFHQGRFCRVESYQQLQADKSVAVLRAPDHAPWFARHLPRRWGLIAYRRIPPGQPTRLWCKPWSASAKATTLSTTSALKTRMAIYASGGKACICGLWLRLNLTPPGRLGFLCLIWSASSERFSPKLK
jgi:enediyne polyketide synthase